MYQTPEQVFKTGNTISVQFSDSIGQVKECSVTIKNVIKGLKKNKLFLEFDQPDLAEQIREGNELTICFEGLERQKNKFGTYVIEKKTGEGQPLILANPLQVDYTSFRRYIRADVDLSFHFFINEQKFEGNLVNLSGCGLFAIVLPNRDLQEKMILRFEFTLPGNLRPTQLIGRIIRIEFVGNPVKQGIAIDFEFIDKYTQVELAVFVTKLQYARGLL
jgi:hypothetical protein